MSEHDMQGLMASLPFGVGYCKLLFNDDGEAVDYIFLDLNPAFEKLTGLSRADLLGKPAAAYFSDRVAARLYDLSFFSEAVRSGKPLEITRWMSVHQRYLTLLITPAQDAHFSIVLREAGQEALTPAGQALGAQAAPTQRKDREPSNVTYRDSLTGLYNRHYIEKAMGELALPENLPLCVIMGDINGLKVTNDIYGRKAGDALVRHVARQFIGNCEPDDVVARWGGGEFIVFLPRTGISRAEEFIRRMQTVHSAVEGHSMPVSISLGCSSREAEDMSIETVMREAEDAMYHQKLLERKSGRNAIINTLLAALYEKSNETEEHSKRIEKYCHAMGRELRLSSKEMNELSLLALLHDIGKVGIDRNILQKPGPLTRKEAEEMKRHPEVGCRIIQNTPELALIADLILSHHEHWDGSGYPNGLTGEEIPLACRILALADAYDAMTNDRAYHKAQGRQEAIREIERNAGIQFDPDIAGVFLWLLRARQEGG